jgi:teichuronic acid exporter
MTRNLIWDITGKAGVQAVTLLVSLLLMGPLEPREFGVVGLALVIIFFISLFLDLGFSRAIIQKKNADQTTFSGVFILNLVLALVFALIFFAAAGPLAHFFGYTELRDIMRVLSLQIVFSGMSLVPMSILMREMKFRQLSIIALTSALISGGLAVWMALNGYGVWSLVVQHVLSSLISMALYFVVSRWLPGLIGFKKEIIKPLWNYGRHLFYSSLLNSVATRLDALVIGKFLDANSLGLYTRAQSMDNVIRTVSAGSVTSVFFVAASKLQDSREQLLQVYKKYLHLISFVAIGIAGLLYLVVPDVFRLLFDSKWDTAAYYFQLMAMIGFAWPVSSLMVSVISGTGNSPAFLRVEFIKTAILLSALVFLYTNGIVFYLFVMIGARMLMMGFNAYFVSKEINISMIAQLGIVLRYAAQALIIVLFVDWLLAILPAIGEFTRILFLGGSFSVLFLAMSAFRTSLSFR